MMSAARRTNGMAGEESDGRLADDGRIGGETIVDGGVRHDQGVGQTDRRLAERVGTRDRRPVEPDVRLHPVAVSAEKAHRCRGDPEHVAGQPDDPVEPLLGRRVEHADGLEIP